MLIRLRTRRRRDRDDVERSSNGRHGRPVSRPGWAPARTTFRDRGLQRQFERDGFVVQPLLDGRAAQRLNAEFHRLYTAETDNWCHRSQESTDVAYRRELHRLITGAFEEPGAQLLDRHRSFSSAALVKWPGPSSSMPVHPDWTAVDESRFRSVNVWVPLVDVDIENGALSVIAGSHRLVSPTRANPDKPSWYEDPLHRIVGDSLTTIPMRAGECLIFDHALVHGSPPNLADDPRTALVLAFAPEEAELIHYWRRPDDQLELLRITDPDFFRRSQPGSRPTGREVVTEGEVEFVPHAPWIEDWLSERVRVRPT